MTCESLQYVLRWLKLNCNNKKDITQSILVDVLVSYLFLDPIQGLSYSARTISTTTTCLAI